MACFNLFDFRRNFAPFASGGAACGAARRPRGVPRPPPPTRTLTLTFAFAVTVAVAVAVTVAGAGAVSPAAAAISARGGGLQLRLALAHAAPTGSPFARRHATVSCVSEWDP